MGRTTIIASLAFLMQLWSCGLGSALNYGNHVTVLTAAFKKVHFILDVAPVEKFDNISLIDCLELCLQHYCKAINYGDGECSLLTSVYCESDLTRKALTVREGFVYHEISKTTYTEDCARNREDIYSNSVQETECVTDGKRGPEPKGSKCRFPFVYKGVKYHGCTKVGFKKNPVFWCSTDESTKEYNEDKWGSCSTECPTVGTKKTAQY